ncbi:Cytochrome P450 monooygenase [Lachnellula suecica]|uniref:Cytochrome P450 monooygenase n=1 Tax=Lachnellula suecica TaxID=602035 RepID=A0A8T9CES2_9HELO|nr:Cytochrome P450 monooygenase [Lachnellula suecica]
MSVQIDSDTTILKLFLGIGVAVILFAGPYLLERLSELRLSRNLISRYPIANEKWDAEAKKKLATSAETIIKHGVALARGNPFLLNDKSATRLIIPPKYIEEIKNDKRLDFHGYVSKQFFSTYPGFDVFNVDQTIFQPAVRVHLTQALTLTVEPLAKEAPNMLKLVYGDAPDWKETVLISSLLKAVSRLTSLIFLGEKFMNCPEWQQISVMYTVDAFMAATALNNWPAPVRPFVHWFLPECRKLRQEVKAARAFITPEVDRRRKELAMNAGKPRKKVLDSIDCYTLGFAMSDLAEHPEYVDTLREEIKSAYTEEGKWEKTTLFKLRFMDSFLKESMRYHPHTLFTMPRQAKTNITLSDGTMIPNNTILAIGPLLMSDSNVFPNADKFDPYRFLKLRETPGAENKHQFVTTSPEIIVFGHGHHACPGRFFASNEIKILLAHMIMHYDWKLPEGQKSIQHNMNGTGRSPNSRQSILYRSRKPVVEM